MTAPGSAVPALRGLLVGLCLLVPAAAPSAAQDRAQRIDRLLRAYHQQRQFNGGALVAEAGSTLYKAGHGHASMEWEVPNAPDTRFRIGSITKQFTAALVLLLVEDGRLSLDGTLAEYLPDYPKPQAERVRIRHLLDHTSGIPSYTDLPDFMEDRTRDPLSPAEIAALTWSEPLEFEPGTGFSYNNTGYVLLGWIVERVTGRPYDAVLRERILEPLGLRDTGYDHESEVRERGAVGYTRTLTGYENAPYIDTSLPHAAGMLYSTVEDLHRWMEALLGGEVFEDPASLERMLTPNEHGYAYGIAIREVQLGEEGPTVRVFQHSGGIFGFSSVLRHLPHEGRTIVLLDNTAADLDPILEGITAILYGLPAEVPKASIAERILPVIEAAGVEAGLARYRERKRIRPDDYDYGPRQFLLLGRHFLEAGDTVTAVALLEANVEEHPELPLPRYALAETVAGAGDTARATTLLVEALQRRPGVTPLIQALVELGVEVEPALRLPVVPQPPETLRRYVGDYRIEPGLTLSVRLDGRRLIARRSGEAAFELLPQSETLFLLHGSSTQLSFEVEAEGRAARVTIVEGGRRVTFPRIE